ncbi:hypothetical protein EMCRGX_G001376 [Ephydatia muelleri]
MGPAGSLVALLLVSLAAPVVCVQRNVLWTVSGVSAYRSPSTPLSVNIGDTLVLQCPPSSYSSVYLMYSVQQYDACDVSAGGGGFLLLSYCLGSPQVHTRMISVIENSNTVAGVPDFRSGRTYYLASFGNMTNPSYYSVSGGECPQGLKMVVYIPCGNNCSRCDSTTLPSRCLECNPGYCLDNVTSTCVPNGNTSPNILSSTIIIAIAAGAGGGLLVILLLCVCCVLYYSCFRRRGKMSILMVTPESSLNALITNKVVAEDSICANKVVSQQYFDTLRINKSLLCGAQDKCCCEQCVTAVDKGHKGWVLFGVSKTNPRWSVAYWGVPCPDQLGEIIAKGLGSVTKGSGSYATQIMLSPSLRYCLHKDTFAKKQQHCDSSNHQAYSSVGERHQIDPQFENEKLEWLVDKCTVFSGEGNWSQWIYHFENVAEVNEWEDAKRVLWLKVRLTGRAQIAYQQLSDITKANYGDTKKALKERFEPASQTARYLAEFENRRKKKTDGWADFAEDLRSLVEKAYPALQEEAKAQIALSHYLRQLDQPMTSFSVKQRTPKSLDEAVSATLEIESYQIGLPKIESGAVGVPLMDSKTHPEVEEAEIGTVASRSSSQLQDGLVHQLLQRLDKIEHELRRPERERDEKASDGQRSPRSVTCWNCGRRGHLGQGTASLIVDTGAGITLLRRDVWKGDLNGKLLPWYGCKLVGANGGTLNVVGMVRAMQLGLGGKMFAVDTVIVESLTSEGILGLDFLEKYECIIDAANGVLTLGDSGLHIQLQKATRSKSTEPALPVHVCLDDTIVIPPRSEIRPLLSKDNILAAMKNSKIYLIDMRHMPLDNFKWIHHIVGHWSKFSLAYPLLSKTAKKVANALEKSM